MLDKLANQVYNKDTKNGTRKEKINMKIERYTTELNWVYDSNHSNSHYIIENCAAYRNRGELCESICKHHRGIYTEINPHTSWCDGSDIESEFASVKSSEGGLGRGIGGYDNSASDKIKTYFKNTHSKTFIWVELNEETKEVVEYQMNRSEFGKFVQKFTRVHRASNKKEITVRFRATSKKMITFLEGMAV